MKPTAPATYEVRVRAVYGGATDAAGDDVVGPWLASGHGSANELPAVPAVVSVNENTQTNLMAGVTDPDAAAEVFTYTLAADGVDSGNDNDRFELHDFGGTAGVRFVAAPDYEVRQDDNEDNTYILAVTVADSLGGETVVAVDVVVGNVAEAGALTLSTNAPRAGVAVVATLTEGDTLLADSVEYTWEVGANGAAAGWGDAGPGTDAADGTSSRFTPTAAHEGEWLRVTVRYHDHAMGTRTNGGPPGCA